MRLQPRHTPLFDRIAARPAATLGETGGYRLALPRDERLHLAKGWLALGLGALLASGLFSILLVLSRTPGVNRLFPGTEFFRVALVVHVDLSVLIWFVAFAGLFWTLAASRQGIVLARGALWLCTAAAVGMCVAAFSGEARPIMANYIPLIDNLVFKVSLLLLAGGAVLAVAAGLITPQRFGAVLDGSAALRLGLLGAAASTAVALFAFLWSWLALPPGLDGKTYYELLFWGGGHVLQFSWTLLLLVAWLWLTDVLEARLPFTPRVVLVLFALALLLVLATPFIYLAHDVTSVEHRRLLTWMMRVGGGFAILPLVLGVAVALLRAPAPSERGKPVRAALIMSLTLFLLGGLIGFLIQGNNVKIPAHYHGCIVGITLALMGVAFDLLPRMGFAPVRGRLAQAQPIVYGIGQLMHITGLVWSGGYGVQRKVAGADQWLNGFEQVAGMALMGLGGLVAIVGGVLFIVVVARSVHCHSSPRHRGAMTPGHLR